MDVLTLMDPNFRQIYSKKRAINEMNRNNELQGNRPVDPNKLDVLGGGF